MAYIGEFFPQSNLVGLWHLNGNSNDSSGNGNNGTDTSITYSYANGRFAQGAGFNGSSSYIDIPNSSIPSTYSFALYIRTNSLSTTMAAITKDDVNTNRTFSLEINTSGSATLYAWNSSGTIYSFSFPVSSFAVGQRRFVVFVWDSSNAKLLGYLDGNLANTPTSITGTPKNTSYKITLGRQNTSTPGKYFNGSIDEVVVFSRALSDTEIRKWYAWSVGKLL